MLRAILIVLLSLLLLNCGPADVKVEPTNRELTITAAPAEVEYIPGQKTKVWAYNGQVPGPTLNANVGDTFTVKFINNLPEPSTLHWHGLELPANMDGSHISQKPVPPGGTFTYSFKVLRAGTYWYHSHVKPNEQVERGLHGMMIVHDPKENQKLGLPTKEINLLLDDVLLDKSFQVEKPLPDNPLERIVTLTNGREGNFLLANGKYQSITKVEVGEPLRIRLVNASNSRFFRLSLPGQKLLRIGGDIGLLPEVLPINTINKDTVVPNSLNFLEVTKNELVLTPGERAEVLWVPEGRPGQRINLEWHDIQRGRHQSHYLPDGKIDLIPDRVDGLLPKQTVKTFQLTAPNFSQNYETLKVGDSLRAPLDEEISLSELTTEKPLKIMFGHNSGDAKGNVMFFAAAKMHHHHGDKGHHHHMEPLPYMKLTNETALNAKVGEVRIIEVTNMSRGIHPFHIHGFPFQLLETEYIDSEHPENNFIIKNDERNWREWKDTIPVPGRLGFRMKSKTVMRLLVRLDDKKRASEELIAYGGKSAGSLSGGWMVHCHILEHSRHGMATWLNLWPKDLD